MSASGTELRQNNEKIVHFLTQLRNQRKEMTFLIEKQTVEKVTIENELEKLSFKLTLLVKSLGQRLKAQVNYDKTINEIEQRYTSLVDESGKLLSNITREVENLDEIMDKKIGTSAGELGKPTGKSKSNCLVVARCEGAAAAAPESEPRRSEPRISIGSCSARAPSEATLSTGDEEAKPARSSPRVSRAGDATRLSHHSSACITPNCAVDAEVQNYRDAYGRQHIPKS